MANNTTLENDLWKHPVSIGIRSLFYVVTPSETSFEKIEDVPNYVAKVSVLSAIICFKLYIMHI